MTSVTIYNSKNESVYNGSESIACLGPDIWNRVQSELKQISSIRFSRKAMRDWYPRDCPCRLCKTYLGNNGFI